MNFMNLKALLLFIFLNDNYGFGKPSVQYTKNFQQIINQKPDKPFIPILNGSGGGTPSQSILNRIKKSLSKIKIPENILSSMSSFKNKFISKKNLIILGLMGVVVFAVNKLIRQDKSITIDNKIDNIDNTPESVKVFIQEIANKIGKDELTVSIIGILVELKKIILENPLNKNENYIIFEQLNLHKNLKNNNGNFKPFDKLINENGRKELNEINSKIIIYNNNFLKTAKEFENLLDNLLESLKNKKLDSKKLQDFSKKINLLFKQKEDEGKKN